MRVLIVASCRSLGQLWARTLGNEGHQVLVTYSQAQAVDQLHEGSFEAIILDLDLDRANGSSLAIADFANYRRPEAQVLLVTRDRFFSDGTIFGHCGNARAVVPTTTPPKDLSAMVEHYAAGV